MAFPQQHYRADLSTIWLLGDPVSHSLSPLIQNRAIEALGADVLYVAAAVAAESFDSVVQTLPRMGALGANVTVPHKLRAFEICDERSDRAQLMGAVNTLHFRPNGIYGDNTDGFGWWNSLEQATKVESFKQACVIGAGGAARAICHTLCQKGLGKIHILNRTATKADILAQELRNAHSQVAEIFTAPPTNFRSAIEENTLVVQTTSVGLKGEASPVDLPSKLPPNLFLSELIYGRTTPLMKRFQELGGAAQDGLGMLCGQAALSLSLWLQKEPAEIPLHLMIEEARRHLGRRSLS